MIGFFTDKDLQLEKGIYNFNVKMTYNLEKVREFKWYLEFRQDHINIFEALKQTNLRNTHDIKVIRKQKEILKD